MKWEYSCGAVVFADSGGLRRYVIIRSLGGDYGFPKGHVEPGETEQDTAMREIWEEVRLCPRILEGFREVHTYALPNKPGVCKKVVFYLAKCENPEPRHQPEELSGVWLMTFGEAMNVLTFENSRAVLRAAEQFLEEIV